MSSFTFSSEESVADTQEPPPHLTAPIPPSLRYFQMPPGHLAQMSTTIWRVKTWARLLPPTISKCSQISLNCQQGSFSVHSPPNPLAPKCSYFCLFPSSSSSNFKLSANSVISTTTISPWSLLSSSWNVILAQAPTPHTWINDYVSSSSIHLQFLLITELLEWPLPSTKDTWPMSGDLWSYLWSVSWSMFSWWKTKAQIGEVTSYVFISSWEMEQKLQNTGFTTSSPMFYPLYQDASPNHINHQGQLWVLMHHTIQGLKPYRGWC